MLMGYRASILATCKQRESAKNSASAHRLCTIGAFGPQTFSLIVLTPGHFATDILLYYTVHITITTTTLTRLSTTYIKYLLAIVLLSTDACHIGTTFMPGIKHFIQRYSINSFDSLFIV